MSGAEWLALVGILLLGAMSPGPSLAVVLQNTLQRGSSAGRQVAVGHGIGVFVYALATVTGIAGVFVSYPLLLGGIRWLGALFLAYLGLKSLLGSSGLAAVTVEHQVPSPGRQGLRCGLYTALSNPKLALFFVALLSQFVSESLPLPQRLLMAILAGIVDGGWYLLVVLSLSHARMLEGLRAHALWVDRIFGVLLLLLAVQVMEGA